MYEQLKRMYLNVRGINGCSYLIYYLICSSQLDYTYYSFSRKMSETFTNI